MTSHNKYIYTTRKTVNSPANDSWKYHSNMQ